MYYWPALLLGFTGSLHCVAMCGPLMLAVPAGSSRSARWLAYRLVYQVGRVSMYALLGVLVALVGKAINVAGWQQGLSVAAGIFLLVWALATARVDRWLGQSALTTAFGGRMKRVLSTALQRGGWVAHLALGVFNGLLPCSLVYLALAGSLVAANAEVGAVWMVAFGLGTLPAIAVTLALGHMAKRPAALVWRVATPIFSAALGLLLILRGLNLGLPFLSPVLEWAERSVPICTG